MTTPMRSRMRRQTRPAKYMSKSYQAECRNRPGTGPISFSGEFPVMYDSQPVEVASRRRDYTGARSTGSYHAVRQDEIERMPAINRHGVHVVSAIGMFALVFVLLFGVFLNQLAERGEVLRAIENRQNHITALTAECAKTRGEITAASNDMNIRQAAVRLGLISSRGVNVEYLQGPADAVIILKDQSVIQSLASIWGQ